MRVRAFEGYAITAVVQQLEWNSNETLDPKTTSLNADVSKLGTRNAETSTLMLAGTNSMSAQFQRLSALIEIHAVATSVWIFLHLEVVRRQPKRFQYTVSQFLQLPHHISHLFLFGGIDARR